MSEITIGFKAAVVSYLLITHDFLEKRDFSLSIALYIVISIFEAGGFTQFFGQLT